MTFFNELHQIISKEQISKNQTLLEQHSRDESYHRPCLPEAVVYPTSTKEVSEIMKLATKHQMPVTPFGYGSSLEGNVIPYSGGISLDFSLMNKIVAVRENDFLVTVQPGVTRSQLNKELKKYGMFFSVDPGADATIGGMAATNASGTSAVRYGIMRDQVRDMEIVLADGMVIHSGNLAAKSSSGYNLNGLFVGSEGTLGLFTELTLRIHGISEHVLAARAAFQTLDESVEAVISLLQAGIPIARVELVDEESMKQINRYSDTDYPEGPTLFLEFHGNEAGLKQDVSLTKELMEDHGCKSLHFETDTAAMNKLWEARHHVAYAYVHNHRGKKQMVTDVCVPISELAGAIKDARKAVEFSGLPGGIVGHVGDGNYHIILMVDPEDEEDLKLADKVNEHIVMYALERGGTCTGEHSVGVGKVKYQEQEHGDALIVMRKLKKALDPDGILNPGKILP